MSDSPVLPLPPNAPRVKPNRFVRWVGRSILRVGGWRMVGRFPDIPKLVMIGAPHSSNWDGLWAFGAKMALGLDVHILAKESLFKVPVLPVYFHYPDKIIGVGELFHLDGDMEADMARIRAWYRPWIGRNRGTV